MKSISIFGFTGSIGTQALNILADSEDFVFDFFVCNKNIDAAAPLIKSFPQNMYSLMIKGQRKN